jgi:hypothetical protein
MRQGADGQEAKPEWVRTLEWVLITAIGTVAVATGVMLAALR